VDKEYGRPDPVPPLLAPSTIGAPDRSSGEVLPPQSAGLNRSRGQRRRRGGDAPRDRLVDRWGGWLRRRGRIYGVIALGGFAGGNARYALGLAWPDKPGAFPWTTFGINVSGAFVLALLLVLILEAWEAPTWLRPLVGTGFLGAFTTFSAVAFSLDRFAAASQWLLFCAYMVFSVLAGLAAASFGVLLGRSWVAARTKHSIPDLADEPSAAPRGDTPASQTSGPATSSDGSSQ
jgi:fluoride exporter